MQQYLYVRSYTRHTQVHAIFPVESARIRTGRDGRETGKNHGTCMSPSIYLERTNPRTASNQTVGGRKNTRTQKITA